MKIEQIYRQNDWWDEINWSQLERDVRRLQGRICRASKNGDKKGTNNLIKLLAKSESAKLLAIYIITQKNKGRNTPGEVIVILSFDLINLETVTLNGERVRGDAIGTLCSSHIRGNPYVWFQEGKGAVMFPTYSTKNLQLNRHHLFLTLYNFC